MTRANTCTSTWTTKWPAGDNRFRDPHAVFEELRAAGENAVVLGSGELGANSRWTFVGVVNEKVKVPDGERGLIFMREFVRKNFRKKKAGEPPFTGGFVGFLSYDLGAKWQGIRQRVKDDVGCPEARFVYVDEVFAFNEPRHHAGKACGSPAQDMHKVPAPKSNLTYSEYADKIRKIKDYLYAGDTYQVNFSQRFQIPFRGDAFELYKRATAINPSPFQFFMEALEFAVISNSPERLMRVEGGRRKFIETRPIKGTVKRGKTAAEDAKNIKKLLASEKEKAELAMITDLERNDIGKICVPGTVKVTENRAIEKYSHVIHTISNVRGELECGRDWYDALQAVFPGGSITGCPKKRTMEIIDELEDCKRGIYCGSAGYIDLSGNCDFNIMIRTLWLGKGKNGVKLLFHSGGGIVADSDPRAEYEETMHKAAALLNAINSR
ncbi:anthranilate synthase component I family protein [Candidatus Peregrinibacteria bacterium]|nr:anthranilate synthase component I family protein [Candidatus Peregrinibacteria bacterium]